ncbi:MAG TPA: carboxymuconolactone decarboxylase family protein [Dehalococcoidia bacterium]|nr:carboxymuconolactone decarboxylase family protein [Dehalococcoidia bacterium]
MPRIRPLTKAEAAPELLPILEQVEQTFGTIHAGTGIFAYCPAILQASNGLGRGIAGSGTLTPLLRSLAMLRVAQLAECPFRMDSLAAVCSREGASHAQIAAVARFRGSGLFDQGEKSAMALAEAITATPTEVADDVFNEARRHFRNEQLVELVATIAAENYRVRFNRAFEVESIGMYAKA